LLCSIPAEKAYVGLALPGNAGSWQKECKVQYEFEPMGFNSLNFKGLAGDGLRWKEFEFCVIHRVINSGLKLTEVDAS